LGIKNFKELFHMYLDYINDCNFELIDSSENHFKFSETENLNFIFYNEIELADKLRIKFPNVSFVTRNECYISNFNTLVRSVFTLHYSENGRQTFIDIDVQEKDNTLVFGKRSKYTNMNLAVEFLSEIKQLKEYRLFVITQKS
jgi:hypothetical protein